MCRGPVFLYSKSCKLWYNRDEGVVDMLDYIRIACIAPAVQVGNCLHNARSICELIRRANEGQCDVALFPELSLSGYTCADLFLQQTLLQEATCGIGMIARCTEDIPHVTVAVGAPVLVAGQLYNCAVVIRGGKVLGIVPKTYLPNDGAFNERRWFAGAGELSCSYISSKELGLKAAYDIPVGNDLLLRIGDGVLAAVEICEDLFAPISPAALLTQAGAEVVLNLSASPATVGKREVCRQTVNNQSAACNCVYAYVSAGCMESTQDMVYTGQCLISEDGTLLAENEDTLTAESYLVCDADVGMIRARRQRNKAVRSLLACYQMNWKTRVVDCQDAPLRSDGSLYPLTQQPFLPNSDGRSVFHIQAAALARRMEKLGAKAVIGVSGGLDSTLALLVAVEACKRLGRPASDVIGITMPCFGTTERTSSNALELMGILGVTSKQIPVTEAVLKHFADIGHDPTVLDVTYENAQARERTQVLMDYAGQVGGIVVGTGDMSELALGWCTYNADHMSMYSVNCGVPKTVIPMVIQSVMREAPYCDAARVLQDVIDTPISPELLPPDPDGSIAQQTQDLVGPYQLHDFFLYYVLYYGFTPKKIFALASRAFADTYEGETVKKWLKVFYKRFFAQQFKRSCMPEGVKVFEVSLSPRADWQMPGDAVADAWLREADEL